MNTRSDAIILLSLIGALGHINWASRFSFQNVDAPSVERADNLGQVTHHVATVTKSALARSVLDSGADPSGSIDSTMAIRAAIANASKVVVFPPGVYLIRPSNPSDPILTLHDGLRLQGSPDAILKVANNVGPYSGVLRCTNCSNVIVDGLTIDANIANNPITGESELKKFPRQEIQLWGGSGNRITNCVVHDSSSVNSIDMNTTTNAVVSGNTFYNMGIDPHRIVHDSSAIYVSGGASGAIITNNSIRAGSFAAASIAATTAIETHIDDVTVSGNAVWGYQAGMNITGVDDVDDSAVTIIGNSIDAAQECIDLWSLRYGHHTNGYGINGAVIADNSCRIRQMEYIGHNPIFGIFFNTSSTLPVRNVLISNNVIVFDKETTIRRGDKSSIGIGSYGAATVGLENVVISGNVIDNAPFSAIRLASNISGVRILNNTVRNSGSSLDPTIASEYRTPISVSSKYPIIGLDVNGNHIIAESPSTSIIHAFVLDSPPGSRDINYIDNDVTLLGTPAAWAGYFAVDPTSKPFVKMRVSGEPWSRSNTRFRGGSEVYDQTSNTLYFLTEKGSEWQTGLTGHKRIGTCMLTIVDGRITNISGC
jgi:putative cofactor-binding repeat protein